jgi:probable rRNA maturation factor
VVAGRGVRAPGLARWLAAIAPAGARGSLTIALVPDQRVRALNKQFRKKDRPTDVLSFPAAAPSALRRGTTDPGGRLGDIVIAMGVARAQAAEAGHSLGTELRVLALHGLLHLLGYDHERDSGRMARVESRLRARGGLQSGLIERHR